MSIGSTIKQLRRENDMTQEQLAEYLGITSRAVSQWECGRTAPDISQLPLLANIFDVSTDVLLGVDIEKNKKKISEILDTAHKVILENGGLEKRTTILREGIRQYPRSFEIMERLADALVCEYSRKGIKDYSEVFDLCNRVLAECTDSTVRNNALQTLGTAYEYAGKEEEMLKVAEQMQPIRFSREVFMLWNYGMKGNDSMAKRQEFLSSIIHYLTDVLVLIAGHLNEDGSFVYPIEDRIKLWEQIVSVIELLFPDGDYQLAAQTAEGACSFLTETYLSQGEVEKSIYWLQKGCDFAIHFDTYDWEAKHTSPALRGYCDGGWIMENGCNHSANLLDFILNDKRVDIIRNDPRVKNVLTRAKEVAVMP